MKILCLIFLIGLSLAFPVDAMWFINKTNEPSVTFTLVLRNRKNVSEKLVTLPAMSRKNESFSQFQSQNQFNLISVNVKWNSGALVCGSFEGDSDNYNVKIYRDEVTQAFKCVMRNNPPPGSPPPS